MIDISRWVSSNMEDDGDFYFSSDYRQALQMHRDSYEQTMGTADEQCEKFDLEVVAECEGKPLKFFVPRNWM